MCLNYVSVKSGIAQDVFFFILRFSQRFNIDLDESLSSKLKSNADKYPVEKARGKNLKYTEL